MNAISINTQTDFFHILSNVKTRTSVAGDIVGLYGAAGCSATSQIGTGIVTKASQTSVTVAFDDCQDDFNIETDSLYNLLKLANDVTYKRMKR